MAKQGGNKGKKGKSSSKGQEKGGSFRRSALMAFFLLVAMVLLPISMMLFIGMLPTLVIFFVSVNGNRSRVVTVGAMNFAGCIPFLCKLWLLGNDFETSIDIIAQPMTVVIMYGAACSGYLIEWVTIGIVSSFLYQKGQGRLRAIEKRQEALVSEWGGEITGGATNSDF